MLWSCALKSQDKLEPELPARFAVTRAAGCKDGPQQSESGSLIPYRGVDTYLTFLREMR